MAAVNQIMMYVAGVQFYINVDGFKEAVEQAVFFQNIPDLCPECNEATKFRTYVTKPPKSIQYWGLECKGSPKHQINFHLFKDESKGFYLMDNEKWTAYEPGQQMGEGNANDAPAASSTTPEQRAETAKTLVDKVKQEGEGANRIFRVGAFVVKAVNGVAVCDCKNYVAGVAADPAYTCEHLYAVRLFVSKPAAN